MVNESLGKITKGAVISFLGISIYLFFEFITRVILARYMTLSEYGTFCIGFALLNVFVLVSCLGLQGGAARCIAYFRGKGECEKVAGVIYSSLQLSITASIFFSVLIFCSFDILVDLFNIEQLIVIKLFAIAIPFLVIVEILSSIFTGFGRIGEKVYFRDVLMSLLKVSGIILAIVFGFGFFGIIYAYLFSTIATAALFAVYAANKLSIGKLKKEALYRKKLFYFSIPLLFTFLSTVMIMRMDTLMLGYFKTSDSVALYNAATPIALLIPVFLNSITFIYISVSSKLYSKNLIVELRRNYAVLTKWVLAATFPFFSTIFLFPETLINIIFGFSYVQAGDALRILTLGMIINVLTGPNSATLLVTGKPKLNMADDLIGAIVNISLNLFLIPVLGIIGAAIATAVSLGTINVLKSAQIFRMYNIHPFTLNYIKPIVTSSVIISIIYFFVNPIYSIWELILLFFLFIIICIISFIATRSLDEGDITMFLEIEKITGINISYVKKILRRFM